MAFTIEQQKAVETRGDNILVSAAAGSGKTTVLVARIINKVIKEKVDIDKLLVSTFTKAAASEMKERLLKAIYKELENNPDDENLQKQISLINHAHISTIHSFCLDVIKNNFFETDLGANIRIGDSNEIEIIKDEAIEKIFQDKYEEKDEGFIKLLELYTKYGDDSNLKDIILNLYKFISSVPYPNKWLEDAVEEFNIEKNDFSNSKMAQEINNETKIVLEKAIEELIEIKKMLSQEIELMDCYDVISKDIESLQNVNLSNYKLTEISIQQFTWGDWSRKRKFSSEGILELKNETKNLRDKVKNNVNTLIKNYYSDTYEEVIEDIQEMYPVLTEIKKILFEFEEEFTKRKREKNIIDYNDIEHITLNLLIDESGEKTNVAKRYDFNEVLVDEYQDINLVQEKILSSVSNGNNMFMVGDVKQCIYRFRKARPDLFLKKYREYDLIEESSNDTNALNDIPDNSSNETDNNIVDKQTKIQLYKNFRSRKSVIDFINIIFQDLMGEETGGIDYDENEYLNLAAEFEKTKIDCKTEMYIIEKEDDEIEGDIETKEGEIGTSDEINSNARNLETKRKIAKKVEGQEDSEEEEIIDNAILEARMICKKIQELKNQGMQYKDMVVLLRSIKNIGPTIEKELIEAGIPVFSDAPTNYLDTIEINTILSLLKIIDNPLQDIPLVTVMRSMIGGFDENELTQIRLNKKEGLYFYALVETAKMADTDQFEEDTEANSQSNEIRNELANKENIEVDKELARKAQEFLKMLEHYKKLEKELHLDELIWTIYSETGYYHYVRLMPNGNIRQANLRKMFEKAKDYEKISFKGLFNFITFMEKIGERNPSGSEEAKMLSENDDVVRIMTIHKSKGLEFPVIFLCGTAKRFNFNEEKKEFVYDQDMGIGFDFKKIGIKYPTLTKKFINAKLRKEQIAEEMRILYVALTRAKEKIIIIGTEKNAVDKLDDKMEKIQKFYGNNRPDKIDSTLVSSFTTYLDWLELVYKYNNNIGMDVTIVNKKELKAIENNGKENIAKEVYIDKKINNKKYDEVDRLLNWKYKFENSIDVPSKTSVTALKTSSIEFNNTNIIIDKENEDIQNKNIKVNNELLGNGTDELKPEEKGSLVHLVLQKLDNTDIEKTIESIKIPNKNKEFLKRNKDIFQNYIESDLFNELSKAKEVHKETPFYMNVKYDKTEERVLIQGIIDLYYINENDELILVDYKTDRNIDDTILKERYYNQLELYKKALEKSMKRNVKKVYIYSTFLNKRVEIT